MSSVEQNARRAGVGGREPDERWERKREELRERGIAYCLSAYVDMHGVPKAKAVPIDHFTKMMGGSELFTGAAIDGLGQGPADDELSVWPDLDAITPLPWEPSVAWAPGGCISTASPTQWTAAQSCAAKPTVWPSLACSSTSASKPSSSS